MGFFNSLKTTYTYKNKSAFISFSEALLWPYRVFAGHMQVILPDATLDQEKKPLLVPQGDEDVSSRSVTRKPLIYKAPHSGLLARFGVAILLPFSFAFGTLLKACTLFSSNVRVRNQVTETAILEHKSEIAVLKKQILTSIQTRDSQEIDLPEFRKNYASFSQERESFFTDFDKQEKTLPEITLSETTTNRRILTWQNIGIRGRFTKLYNDAVNITNQLLSSMNKELRQENNSKDIDPTAAARRLVIQNNIGALGNTYNYSHALMHGSVVDLYQIFRDRAPSSEDAKIFNTLGHDAYKAHIMNNSKVFYTLGTDEYKARVINNTFVKYGFYTMYGNNNAETFRSVLKKADDRFTKLASIDSSKTNGRNYGL